MKEEVDDDKSQAGEDTDVTDQGEDGQRLHVPDEGCQHDKHQ